MKQHHSRTQRNHSTPRPPTTSAWVGELITWGGQEAQGARPSSVCVAGTGCPWVLSESVFLFSCGAQCSVSSPAQLGPKLIPVLCLDGFSLLLVCFFLTFPGPAKLGVLFFTLQSGLGNSLPEVPMFPTSGCSFTPFT